MMKYLRRKGGFTLIEMLMVVLIIGFLVGILMIRASNVAADAKKKAVAADLKSLKAAVETFFIQNDRFPVAAWEAELVGATPRLVDEVPLDPYGTGDYAYAIDSTGAYYLIRSVGPNGLAGTNYTTNANNGTVVVDGDGLDNLWVSNCYVKNHSFE